MMMDSLSNFTIWELFEISCALDIEIIKRTWWIGLVFAIVLIIYCKFRKI